MTECTELPGDVVAVNAISCYGAVGHMLLQRQLKVKASLEVADLSPDKLPRLVILQARNKDAATAIAQKVRH